MRRTQTQSINEVLQDYLNENPRVAEKLAEMRLLQAWGDTLGAAAERYTTSLFIKRKTLYVKISSAILRHELSLCREQLIQNLNKAAGMEVIKEIVLS